MACAFTGPISFSDSSSLRSAVLTFTAARATPMEASQVTRIAMRRFMECSPRGKRAFPHTDPGKRWAFMGRLEGCGLPLAHSNANHYHYLRLEATRPHNHYPAHGDEHVPARSRLLDDRIPRRPGGR